jgi:YesN/AraC family two-component response regulator
VNNSDISIMYVEDDEIVRKIMCLFITAKYANVPTYSAGSAEEGLELFRKHHQSIIMTDINLAGSDGIQMVRSIRALDPCNVIIFITGCSIVERLTEFEGAAPSHYISKPVNFDDLFTLLDKYIKI